MAEGVGTTTQKEFLIDHGCENIQGYIYAKPILAEQIKQLLGINHLAVN
jgi:EAL domain-containing protein (putative c-di-GMP-specific phosphodiesterase class I)